MLEMATSKSSSRTCLYKMIKLDFLFYMSVGVMEVFQLRMQNANYAKLQLKYLHSGRPLHGPYSLACLPSRPCYNIFLRFFYTILSAVNLDNIVLHRHSWLTS
jgi:hypothetical protein